MGDTSSASVARHVDNKLRPLPPQEYICLIGGCTNTFNGWISEVYNPKSGEFIWNPMPRPHNRIEIDYYLTTPQAVDLKTIDKSQWNKYGWSEKGAGEIEAGELNAKDLQPYHPHTHDLYWANFVDPAARLYLNDDSLPTPHQRPQPRKGDIVTFFIYYPSYQDRQRIDWRASPYNFDHHDKFEAAKYWESGLPKGERVQLPGPPITKTVENIEEERKKKEELRKARETDKYRPLSEDDINFYILMRTTSENTEKAIKRPKHPGHYYEYLRGDYGQGPLGTVYKYGALAKVFFFQDTSEVIKYMQTGKWDGEEWTGGEPGGTTDEDGTPAKMKNYVIMPGRPVRKDIYNRPLPVTTPWYKAWDKTPSVDRNVVKIRRFDYFGHSDNENMILRYGWNNNNKGEFPDYDYVMKFEDLEKCFSGKVLTHDAAATLWGCSLGAQKEDGSPEMAPHLAEKFFPAGVVASEQRTSYDHILDSETSMPEPEGEFEWNAAKNEWVMGKGTWKFYPHAKGKAATK